MQNHFDDMNFEKEVLKNEGLVVVEFMTDWCGGCHVMAPIMVRLATDYAEQCKVGMLNTDNSRVVAKTYSVGDVPTILFFRNGQVVDRLTGTVSSKVLEARLCTLINP